MPKAAVVSMLGIGLAVIVSMVIFWSVSKYLKKQISPDLFNHAMINGKDSCWEEKRQKSRLAVSWQASMETPQGIIRVQLKNISQSGAFVVCPEPMAINEKVRMVIDAPNLDPFPLQGEVVWSNIHVPEDKVVHRGMGIRFVENTEEERARLHHALQTNLDEDETE
jgi:Tfp pilus assembly protein PilZ